jgi:hypothetical protein
MAFADLGRSFSFLIYTQSVGLLGRGSGRLKATLPAHRTTQTQNKREQTSMPSVVLEPTTSVFERAKTVHDLDRAATVICSLYLPGLFFFNLHSGGWNQSPLDTAAT